MVKYLYSRNVNLYFIFNFQYKTHKKPLKPKAQPTEKELFDVNFYFTINLNNQSHPN